jgi:hypothetical protein
MEKVYSGILEQSVNNLDQLLMIVNSFKTQMTDAKRLEIINAAANKMDNLYSDLKQFNIQNSKLSIQRSKSLEEAVKLKEIYGIAQ